MIGYYPQRFDGYVDDALRARGQGGAADAWVALRRVPGIGSLLDGVENGIRSIIVTIQGVTDQLQDRVSALTDSLGEKAAEVVRLRDVADRVAALGSKFYELLSDTPLARAFSQIVEWFTATSSQMAEALRGGDVGAAGRIVDPFSSSSALYQLIVGQQYSEAFGLMARWLFMPFALALSGAMQNLGIVVNLLVDPTPWIALLRQLIQAVRDRASITKEYLFQGLSEAFSNFAGIVLGVRLSPYTAIRIGLALVMNLPQPPYGSMITMLLSDPLCQADMKRKGMHVGAPAETANRIIRTGANCFDAQSPEQWIACFEGSLDLLFPNLIRTLSQRGVSRGDLRTVAAAIWRAGGDLSVAFDEESNPGVQAALIGIGIVGVAVILKALGIQDDAERFIQAHIDPTLPDTLRVRFQKGRALFFLLQNLRQEFVAAQYDVGNAEAFFDEAMGCLFESRWNTESAVALMASRGLFQSLLLRNGEPIAKTETTVRLGMMLRDEFPRIRGVLQAIIDALLGSKISTSAPAALIAPVAPQTAASRFQVREFVSEAARKAATASAATATTAKAVASDDAELITARQKAAEIRAAAAARSSPLPLLAAAAALFFI